MGRAPGPGAGVPGGTGGGVPGRCTGPGMAHGRDNPRPHSSIKETVVARPIPTKETWDEGLWNTLSWVATSLASSLWRGGVVAFTFTLGL